jgi:antitoxin ParD1/3/4
MGKNTSVYLGEYFDSFVSESLSTGRYQNASEVLRAGLRLLEAEEQKIQALRAAVSEGIASGHVVDFDPEAHLRALNTK